MVKTCLFVDDALIARREGVVRRSCVASKLPAPVISGNEPWEGAAADPRVYVYGTAMEDLGGGYRLWYNRYHHQVLYATSQDGLTWRRPALLSVEFHSPSVVHDAGGADPDRRYQMLGYRNVPHGRGYWAAHSADGLNWHLHDRNPVLAGGDTCTLSRDPATGEFLAFHKLTHEHRGHVRRLVYLSTSPDMQEWSEPMLAMAPDEQDDEATRARGGICSQFYNLSAFPCSGQWLGLVTHFRLMREQTETGPNQSPHDGPIEVELVHSRDGRSWQRCEDRTPVIACGPHDYDAGCILGVANQPVWAGDEMWVYYTAINTTHGGPMPPKEVTVGRASWVRDRWVSLDAGEAGGSVETRPVILAGETIAVNADASEGEVRVEVADAVGVPLPGYEAVSCRPIRGDQVRHPVRWEARAHAPTDRLVRLRFHLLRSRLYGWSAHGVSEDL